MFDIPLIKKQNFEIESLLTFNYAKTSKEFNKTICYFIDDYQFERLWNNRNRYINILNRFNGMLSPEFSIYTDSPGAVNIYNTYRNRFLGEYYQKLGIKVIPSICWGGKNTFDYVFEGVEQSSIVAIELHGINRSLKTNILHTSLFYSGLNEMVKRINPEKIICYGEKIPDMPDNVIYYEPYYKKFRR